MIAHRLCVTKAARRAVLAALALPAALAHAQEPRAASPVAWHDPSPHTVRRVPTAPGVELEVLDWGGTGPALIFLAGFGNSAHVFDGFAPRFTRGFHVIGITRRGFGASSKPSGGYDGETLARDVLAVMDQMRIGRASFVVHSYGGSELNWLAARAPGRVARGVYLDAGFDFAEMYATPAWMAGPFPRPADPEPDPNTPASRTVWMQEFAGAAYPESEVRAMFEVDANGQLGEYRMVDSAQARLIAGTSRAAFRQIQAPMLAIYGLPRTVREKYPWYARATPQERRVMEGRFQVESRIYAHQRSRFRAEVPRREITEVPGGRHYVFLTHPDVVEARIQRFLRPPPPSR